MINLFQNKNLIKFDVDEACNGDQAIDCYKKNHKELFEDSSCIHSYEFIIMDLGMPLKNGLEASKEILKI